MTECETTPDPIGTVVTAEGVDTDEPTLVVGVSIPIPEPHGPFLEQRRRDFGDPAGHSVPAHVTLLPPTEVTRAQAKELREHLAQVAAQAPPFDMVLRGTGTFRPISPVVYVQVAKGVSSCERLERAVRNGPISREVAFPYHPHVTVALALDDAALDRAFDELADYSARFCINAFRYYELGDDEVWRACGDHELTGAPQVRGTRERH